MTGPRTGPLPFARRAGIGSLRVYWIVILLFGIALWPYSGLSAYHFVFFAALFVGLYLSYVRQILPLIVYFSLMLLYWVIVPVLQHRIGVGYYTWSREIPEFGPTALAFVVTHLLGILAGFKLRPFSRRPARPRKTRFSIFGLGLMLGLLLLLMAFVGFKTIILPRVEQSGGDAQNYIIFLRNTAKLLPALLLTFFLLEADKGLGKNTRVVGFVLLACCFLIVSNPVNTSRFLSLFGLFVVVIAYSVRFSKLKLLAWALALAPFYAIFLLGITSAMRTGLDRIGLFSALNSLQSLEFSSYSIFLDALKLESFPQGNYLLSHLFIIIPRSVWPGKAESIGIHVAERSGYVYHNVGLNSFVNAYADYGFAGLFLFSLVFGFLARNLNPVLANASFRNRHFMYAVLFTGVTPMFFRGDLSTMMLALYPAILVYEMARFATRFRLMRSVR